MNSKEIEALTKRVNNAIKRLEACALSPEDEENLKINTMIIRVNRVRRKTLKMMEFQEKHPFNE